MKKVRVITLHNFIMVTDAGHTQACISRWFDCFTKNGGLAVVRKRSQARRLSLLKAWYCYLRIRATYRNVQIETFTHDEWTEMVTMEQVREFLS